MASALQVLNPNEGVFERRCPGRGAIHGRRRSPLPPSYARPSCGDLVVTIIGYALD